MEQETVHDKAGAEAHQSFRLWSTPNAGHSEDAKTELKTPTPQRWREASGAAPRVLMVGDENPAQGLGTGRTTKVQGPRGQLFNAKLAPPEEAGCPLPLPTPRAWLSAWVALCFWSARRPGIGKVDDTVLARC